MASVAVGTAVQLYQRGQRVAKTANRVYGLAQSTSEVVGKGAKIRALLKAVFVEIKEVYDETDLSSRSLRSFWTEHRDWLPEQLVALSEERFRGLHAYLTKRRSQLVMAQRGSEKEQLHMLARESGQLGNETYLEKVLAHHKNVSDCYDLCLQHVISVQSAALRGGGRVPDEPQRFLSPFMEEIVTSQKLLAVVSSPRTGKLYVQDEVDRELWILHHNPAVCPGATVRLVVAGVGGITHVQFEIQVHSLKSMAKETARTRDVFTMGRRWVVIADPVALDQDGRAALDWQVPADFFAANGCKPHRNFSFRVTSVAAPTTEEPLIAIGRSRSESMTSNNSAAGDAEGAASPATAVALLDDEKDLTRFLDSSVSIHCDSEKFAMGLNEEEHEGPPELSLRVIQATLDGSVVSHPEWKCVAVCEFARPQDGGYYTEMAIGTTGPLPGPSPEWDEVVEMAKLPPSSEKLLRIRIKQWDSGIIVGDAIVLLSQLSSTPLDVDLVQRANPQSGAIATVKKSKIFKKGALGAKALAQKVKGADDAPSPLGVVVSGSVRLALAEVAE
jgi:hypothetical protein